MRRQAFAHITLRGDANCINNPTEACLGEQFTRPTYPPCGLRKKLCWAFDVNQTSVCLFVTKRMNVRIASLYVRAIMVRAFQSFVQIRAITWQILTVLYSHDVQILQRRGSKDLPKARYNCGALKMLQTINQHTYN